jgi:hypothetical protein
MRLFSTLLFLSFAIAATFGILAFKTKPSPTSATYNAQLVSTQQTGSNYEWVWSVSNPNPGSGTNGTLQNLSHWSLAISDLVTLQDIVGVAYSSDGVNWTPLPVHFAIDKSQECYLGTVLKFDYGTTGSAPTYYQLIVNKDFPTGFSLANFKSGNKTGCYNAPVMGIGNPTDGGIDR